MHQLPWKEFEMVNANESNRPAIGPINPPGTQTPEGPSVQPSRIEAGEPDEEHGQDKQEGKQ